MPLAEYRRNARLTQSELAERAGLTLRAYGMYERGERIPRADALRRLADALVEVTPGLELCPALTGLTDPYARERP